MVKKKKTTKKKKVAKKKKKATSKSIKVSNKKVRHTAETKKALKKAKTLRKKTAHKKPTTKREGKFGRPTVLTEELIERVSSLILAGAYIETACAACGLSKALYYEWLKLGENRRVLKSSVKSEKDSKKLEEIRGKLKLIDPIYEQFGDAIEEAVVQAELRDLVRVDKAGEKSWQAAAWKLERKYPARWAKQYNVDHSGEIKTGGETIDETRRKILKLMEDPRSLKMAKELAERINSKDEK